MPEHEEENKDSLANKSSDFSPSDAQVSNSFLPAPTKLEIWGILIPILYEIRYLDTKRHQGTGVPFLTLVLNFNFPTLQKFWY